jgi:hypothetical protein
VVYSEGRNAGNPILEAQWYIMKGGVQETQPLEHSGIWWREECRQHNPWSTVVYGGGGNAGNPTLGAQW